MLEAENRHVYIGGVCFASAILEALESITCVPILGRSQTCLVAFAAAEFGSASQDRSSRDTLCFTILIEFQKLIWSSDLLHVYHGSE